MDRRIGQRHDLPKLRSTNGVPNRTRCQIRHDGQGVPALVRTLLSAVDFLSVAHALVRLRKVSREISDQKSHKRSEEHTSELKTLMRISYAVFCLKKKIKQI